MPPPPVSLNLPDLLALLGVSLVLAWAMLCVWTVVSIMRPPRRTYTWALARNRPGDPSELAPQSRPFTSWTFETDGLQLPVWDLPGDDPDGPVAILSHGWGDSRIGALSRIPWLLPICSRIIALDMRGHGEAPGRCTLGHREAHDLRRLCEQASPASPLILFGWSLGAGVSIDAARSIPGVIGVIAEAPYRYIHTPTRHMLQALGMPWRTNLLPALSVIGWWTGAGTGWNRPEPFDRAAKARGLTCPLLVIHGDQDGISPAKDGQEIAAAASNGHYATIAGGGHHGLWTQEATAIQCSQQVAAFIEQVARSAQDQPLANQPDS
ncbi:MAG: alpha/beta hydrolase [Planctomycetota bacterium]|nr:alpha/beta hydrolase [Planctomycetota bacterium]